MNKKALIVAACSAVAGVALLQVYMTRFEDEVRGGDLVDVVVAKREITMGSVITQQSLGVIPLPRTYLNQRHLLASDIAHAVGTRSLSSIRANDAVLWTDLAAARERSYLADLISEGMRAVPIRASNFDGQLNPGDRVDVLFVTKKVDMSLGSLGVSDTKVTPLLQNVLVLAVKGRTHRDPAQKCGGGSGSITLALTPAQAQLVAVSEAEGDLQLLLRNPDDLEVRTDLAAVSTEDLRNEKRRERFRDAHQAAAAAVEEVGRVR
jgi:pilus assembly protein CpaB